jgi:hypothetical protein
LGAAVGVRAQDSAPFGRIGSVEAGDFRALAVTSGGDRLMIADAEADQLRIYDFDNPTNPSLIARVDLDGTPTALAATDTYALVTVVTGQSLDAVRVIAPSPYRRGVGYIEVNSIDVPRNPSRIALAPDNRWAVILSERGYTLFELVSAGEINSLPVMNADQAIVDAALGEDVVYLVRGSLVERQQLARGLSMQRSSTLDLGGEGQAIALNAGMTLGAVTLSDNRIALFDPAGMTVLSTLDIASAVTGAEFISVEDAEWLAVTRADSDEILFYDVTDPASPGELASAPTGLGALRAIITYNELVIVTDGQTVSIIAARDVS